MYDAGLIPLAFALPVTDRPGIFPYAYIKINVTS